MDDRRPSRSPTSPLLDASTPAPRFPPPWHPAGDHAGRQLRLRSIGARRRTWARDGRLGAGRSGRDGDDHARAGPTHPADDHRQQRCLQLAVRAGYRRLPRVRQRDGIQDRAEARAASGHRARTGRRLQARAGSHDARRGEGDGGAPRARVQRGAAMGTGARVDREVERGRQRAGLAHHRGRSLGDREHDVERHDGTGRVRRSSDRGASPTSRRSTAWGSPPGASRARRARETRVTGATFDATRGGFAGANIDVRLGPGSRQLQRRNAFITFDPPQLQFTDAVSRSLGTTSGGFRGSVGADGELIRRALTYNVALDVVALLERSVDAGRAPTRTRCFGPASSPDSVARLLAIATPLGIPLEGQGVPSNRERTSVSWLGRLDDTRDTLQTRALTSLRGRHEGRRARLRPTRRAGGRGRAARAHARRAAHVRRLRRARTPRAHRDADRGERECVRKSRRTAHCPRHSCRCARRSRARPRRSRASRSADRTALTTDDRVDDGGIERDRSGTRTAGGTGSRRCSGVAPTDCDRRERATRWAATRSAHWPISPPGAPSSYSRTLVQPERSGAVWNAATAFVHTYAPSRFFSVMYGARARGRRLRERARHEPRLETALGVRTGAAPARLHVSPRIGFTYTYNRDRDNGSGTSQNPRRVVLPPAGGDIARRHRRVPRSAAARHPRRCVGRHRTVERHAQPLVRRRRGAAARLVELRRRLGVPSECLLRRRRARRARAIGDADRSGLRRATQLAVVARVDHRAFGTW